MSLGLTDSQYYSDIADAIREKTGSEATLAPSEMSTAIAEISGGVIPDYCDFCNEYIELPFKLNANHKIFVDYELPTYINQLQILGNTTGTPSSFYHGLYGDRIYVYTNNGENNWSTSGITVGSRHTLIVNDNGRVVFDGVDKMAGTPNTDQNVHYTIGYRGASFEFIGKMYRFYIYDTVNDEYLCDLVPIWDSEHNRTALKDIINDIVYIPSRRT